MKATAPPHNNTTKNKKNNPDRIELKRVTWSTKTELLKNTGIVLATIISFTILVWALDTLLSGALALIIK